MLPIDRIRFQSSNHLFSMVNKRYLLRLRLAPLCILVWVLPIVAGAQWAPFSGDAALNFPTEIFYKDNTFYLAHAEGLLRSDNYGQTWKECTIGATPQETLGITAASNGVLAGLFDGSIWITEDDGVSWNPACPNAPTGNRYLATLDGDIYAATENSSLSIYRAATSGWESTNSNYTNNVNFIAVAGSRVFVSSVAGVAYSDDHGSTWKKAQGLAKFTDLVTVGNILYCLEPEIGFKKSTDGGLNWTAANFGNVSGAKRACYDSINDKFYFIKPVPPGYLEVWSGTPGTSSKQLTNYKQNPTIISANSGVILAVTTSRVLRSVDGGDHWRYEANGLSPYSGSFLPENTGNHIFLGYAFISLNDGHTMFKPLSTDAGPYGLVNFARVGDNLFATDVFANYTNLYRSVPPYSDWLLRDTSWLFAAYDGKLTGQGNDLLFIAHVSSASWKIYRSSDEGLSWMESGACPPNTVSAMVHHGLLMAVDDNKQFWRSNNGTDWTMTAQLPPNANYTLKSENNQIVAAQLKAFPEQNIMRSKDDGMTWTKINTNIEDPWGIGFDCAAVWGDTLALVNVKGCWLSLNAGNSWIDAQDNLPPGAPENLYFYNGQLFVSRAPSFVRSIENLSPVKASGAVYLDQNHNGVRDAMELPLPDYVVKMRRSGSLRLTDDDGNFQIAGTLSPDTVAVILPVNYGQVSPAYAVINTSLTGQEFGVWYPPGHLDRRVSLIALDPFRPGFLTRLKVHCQNKGSDGSTAMVKMTLPGNLELVSTDPAAGIIAGDSVVWEMPNFPMFGYADFMVTVKTPATVSLGTSLVFSTQIGPVDTDLQPEDNVDTSAFVVVGAYDPNNKQVNQGMVVSPGQLAEGRAFLYTLKFQNVGSYPASAVRITDTIQPSLDPATFQLIAASHPVKVSLHNDRVFEFLFDSIRLHPALSDPEGSEGFVQFAIRPVSGLNIGDKILNSASIYFDYNAAIATNTCQVKVAETELAAGMLTAPALQILPNPSLGRFRVDLPDSGIFEVFDPLGHPFYSGNATPGWLSVDGRDWPAGVYTLVWRGERTTAVGRLVRL